MPILLVILLALGISGGTVAVAQNDLPDEPLYSVKLWSEQVAERLVPGTETKANLAMRFAERRAEEIQELLERGPKKGEPREHFLVAVEHMIEQVETAKKKLDQLEKNPERAMRVSAKLEAAVRAMREVINQFEKREDNDELNKKMRPFKEKLDEVKDQVNEISEKTEDQTSASGLERSARGFFGALENKAAEINKKYNRLVKTGFEASEKLKTTLEQADAKKEEVKTALEAGEYRKAFMLTKEAWRLYLDVGLKLNLERVKFQFPKEEEKPVKTTPETTENETEDENETETGGSGAIQVEGENDIQIEFQAVPVE